MSNEQEEFEQIRQLKSRYFRQMDCKEWDAWEHCFTEDVEAVYEGIPRAAREDDYKQFALQGRSELVNGVKGLLAHPVKSMHQVFMPELRLTSETTATGIWAMFDHLKLPICDFKGWGHYHEEYEKVDGQWKIKKIHLTRLHIDETWHGM